jgi:hypothetical protein
MNSLTKLNIVLLYCFLHRIDTDYKRTRTNGYKIEPDTTSVKLFSPGDPPQ